MHSLSSKMSRRLLLQRAAVAGVALPANGVLLAACGGDDKEPTPTDQVNATASGEMMATAGSTVEPSEPTAAAMEPDSGVENLRWMGKEIEPAQHEGGTLVEAYLGLADDAGLISGANDWGIYEGLVEHPIDADELHSPNLAEAWEVSDDGLIWLFTLRQGVTWHDGEPLIIEDVKFSYDVYQITNPGGFTDFLGMESTEIVDERTFQVTANRPQADFLIYQAGEMVILAQHVLGAIPEEELVDFQLWSLPASTGSDPAQVVGIGPFKFKEFVRDDHVTLVRNDDYWDGRPHLEEVIVRAVADTTAAVTFLATGDIDLIGTERFNAFEPAAIAELDGNPDTVTAQFPSNLGYFAFMNNRPDRAHLFGEVAVREALLRALNRAALAETVGFGLAKIAHSVVPPALGFDEASMAVRYDYDPAAANQLLDEAGWLLNDDGTREKEGQPLAFVMLTRVQPIHETIAAVLKEQWRVVGVQADIESVDDSVYYERQEEPYDFDIVLRGESPVLSDSWFWGCEVDEGLNLSGYCNPEVDMLWQQADREFDHAQRMALLTGVMDLLMSDVATLPLLWFDGVGAHNKRLHNVHFGQWNVRFNMETWWIEPA
jgi:peptide/nickel transport system substrate-binding protein